MRKNIELQYAQRYEGALREMVGRNQEGQQSEEENSL